MSAAHATLDPTSAPPPPPPLPNNDPLLPRILAVLAQTWDLGFTAFGGPPVHFQILHQRFVNGGSGHGSPYGKPPTRWLDEQTYQEIFAVSQSLPGPASTKMLFNIALLHAGWVAAFAAFLSWSLPVAVVMYGLALGIGSVGETLPPPVYPLLSGLNASTVGVVALAAVQLAQKAITDRVTRVLVIWGACAGLCYSALWYFPVLIVVGAIVCGVWDLWLSRKVERLRVRWQRRKERGGQVEEAIAGEEGESVEMSVRGQQQQLEQIQQEGAQRRRRAKPGEQKGEAEVATQAGGSSRNVTEEQSRPRDYPDDMPTIPQYYSIPIATGIGLIALTFAIFIALVVSRSLLTSPPRPLALLANMYQAGILIFGGGPVVIPLLREYVVQPGWVSSRDFLLGLAIIQAMPGPNFNFSVYLGALAMAHTGYHSVLGAFLSFVAIFAPGLLLTLGVQGLWAYLRTKAVVVSVLRGVNATAVGLVFTAVYRLWEIGYLTPEESQGQSLAMEPWWVVVAALTYCEVAWFSVPPAAAIVGGAVLGLCWYGAVGRP